MKMNEKIDTKKLKAEYECLLKAMNEILTPHLVTIIIREKDELMKKYKQYFPGWDEQNKSVKD